eukprot:scaffold48960_cov49-Phaeocystis_antarctica.AAC.4
MASYPSPNPNPNPSPNPTPNPNKVAYNGVALCYLQKVGGRWQYVSEVVVHDEAALMHQLGVTNLTAATHPDTVATPHDCRTNTPTWGWQPSPAATAAAANAAAATANAAAATAAAAPWHAAPSVYRIGGGGYADSLAAATVAVVAEAEAGATTTPPSPNAEPQLGWWVVGVAGQLLSLLVALTLSAAFAVSLYRRAAEERQREHAPAPAEEVYLRMPDGGAAASKPDRGPWGGARGQE